MMNANKIRRRILELALNAGAHGAHLGGSLSCVEILVAIYSIINLEHRDEDRDRVILSKGHGALALYCVLESVGLMSSSDLSTFETNGTHLFAHASRDISKGIEFSGGSLGLGISYATGVALATKLKGLNCHIYVIVGDGECAEGIFWESLEVINKYKLNNMTIIVDCNKVQADGPTKEIMDLDSLSRKINSFGISTAEVDGHSIDDLICALQNVGDTANAIIAHTIKGKGVSFMENTSLWHHGVLTKKKYEKALSELN